MKLLKRLFARRNIPVIVKVDGGLPILMAKGDMTDITLEVVIVLERHDHHDDHNVGIKINNENIALLEPGKEHRLTRHIHIDYGSKTGG